MKILKYLLLAILFLIIITIGVLFFSGKIIESKLNNKETYVENFKFSIGKREVTFDNITINGNKLGSGRAKLGLKRFFLDIFDSNIHFKEMELNDVDFNRLFAAPDENIDKFISKIQIPDKKIEEGKAEETEEKLSVLESNTNEILNFDFSEKLAKLENLKREFSETQDLDTKISKLKEISSESELIRKEMTEKKSLIANKIADLDNESIAVLQEYTNELEDLNNTVKSSNIDNIKKITFIDKGIEILQDLNKSLKIVKIIEDFNSTNLTIEKITFNNNNSKLIIHNIGLFEKAPSAEYTDEHVIYKINQDMKLENFSIVINRDKLIESVVYHDGKITSVINYTKVNYLPNVDDIKIETKLDYSNDTLNIMSNNSITKEQEDFIVKSIEEIKQERLTSLSENYEKSNTQINTILDQLYTKEKELESQILKLKVLSTSSNIINTLGE